MIDTSNHDPEGTVTQLLAPAESVVESVPPKLYSSGQLVTDVGNALDNLSRGLLRLHGASTHTIFVEGVPPTVMVSTLVPSPVVATRVEPLGRPSRIVVVLVVPSFGLMIVTIVPTMLVSVKAASAHL